MIVDSHTLADLEIFGAPGGRPGLFELLDRTRTRGGREALKARFQKPLSTVDEIFAVQEALRFIIANRTVFDLLPHEGRLSDLGHYLRSNVVLLEADGPVSESLEAVWVRLTYRDLFDNAAAGIGVTSELVESLSRLVMHGAVAAAPSELGRRLMEMRGILERPELAQLAERARILASWHRVLATDRDIRETSRVALDRLLQLVNEVDALVSMADAVREHGYVFPTVSESPAGIEAEGVYHPLLERPVGNPLRIGARRLLFLTGPNMAGKTTYLRSCAVATYLAHLGMGVPARAFRFSPFDRLLSGISTADDLRAGVSYFRAEALRIKQIAAALAEGEHVIVFLDEPFKGTNVKDALDASREVLSVFARSRGSIFLVASHLIELAEPLHQLGSVDCRQFEAQEADSGLLFDYTIRPGASSQRLGMRVLQDEGVFEVLSGIPMDWSYIPEKAAVES